MPVAEFSKKDDRSSTKPPESASLVGSATALVSTGGHVAMQHSLLMGCWFAPG